jgi:hypothetical protein
MHQQQQKPPCNGTGGGEVAEYKAAAEIYLGLSDNQIAQAVESKELEEVPYHAQEI